MAFKPLASSRRFLTLQAWSWGRIERIASYVQLPPRPTMAEDSNPAYGGLFTRGEVFREVARLNRVEWDAFGCFPLEERTLKGRLLRKLERSLAAPHAVESWASAGSKATSVFGPGWYFAVELGQLLTADVWTDGKQRGHSGVVELETRYQARIVHPTAAELARYAV